MSWAYMELRTGSPKSPTQLPEAKVSGLHDALKRPQGRSTLHGTSSVDTQDMEGAFYASMDN